MNDIASHIRSGRFSEAVVLFEDDLGGSFDAILSATFDDPSTLFYAFLTYLIGRDETAERHHVASQLMSTALCQLPDGYATALFHSRRALMLDRDNVDVKKDMLLFYDLPERLLSREEAVQISREVLASAPKHLVAQATKAGVSPELLLRQKK